MNGVRGLGETVRLMVKERGKSKEQQAQRGIIRGGRVYSTHALSYPIKTVVDVNIYDGAKVWFILDTSNSTAIIVGA